MRKTIIFICLLVLFTSSHAYAWDNPNKSLVNTGVYALKTAMIGAYMNGFNDGKNNLSKDEDYTYGDYKDFLKFYEEGYYKGRVFRNQKM
jgi:hypothetical protein